VKAILETGKSTIMVATSSVKYETVKLEVVAK
jgi:hypothetical protein